MDTTFRVVSSFQHHQTDQDHQSLNNSTTSSSSRSSRQEQNYPYPQEDDEECFNFFMDEEDLSSSSSRHYYPYQPHPSSTTGIDDAFPFDSPYDDTDQKLASYFLQTFFSHITQAGDRTYKTLASASKKTCSFKSTRKTCSFVTAGTTAQKVMKEIKARMEKEADLDIGLEGFEFVKGFEECLRWFRVYFEALDRIFPRTSNEHLMLEREAGRAMVDLVACSLVESVERWGVWVFYGSTGG
ncbi:hypothetical protein GYH30_031604 [Glycine max]|uniref:Uncharacterized protein n=1 Tax=Glycine max TaxID=3847 RepID=K7LQP7_SOYBN|nr:hypothetical protein GYH30_031604 [Glycine max]